jgi:hypothetical protein
LNTPTKPPISCLQIGKPSSNRPQSDHDTCWSRPNLLLVYWLVWLLWFPNPYHAISLLGKVIYRQPEFLRESIFLSN